MSNPSHDPEAMKKVLNRLKRAEGQLHALVASIGPDANCRDVVTQLAAVSKALDRAEPLLHLGESTLSVTDHA